MPPEDQRPTAPPDSADSIDEVYERVRALGQESEQILTDLLSGESRFRRLAKAVWQVQEDERRRLARELHDGIGQTLAALKNQLEWMANSKNSNADRSRLGDAVQLASQALDDTRELSRLLRPPVLDDLGLRAALSWLGRTVSKRFEFEVTIEFDAIDQRPAAEIETVLFRIAQEALTNAAKHAGASRVALGLRTEGSDLVLTVTDDGSGFDPRSVATADDNTGVGLRGMNDRVELFEGRLEISSEPGSGTRIEARLPYLARSEA